MTDPAAAARARESAHAMARGQAALAAGDPHQAAHWLDRARRVSGGNDAVCLLLASVKLRLGDPDAAPMFEALARRHDLREAWLGLAQARHRAGEAEPAAAALHEALAGHEAPLPEPLWKMAQAIASAAGASGLRHQVNGKPRIVPVGAHRHGRVIGHPAQPARIDRLEGFVEAVAGGLAGWAWHPNHPAAVPRLRWLAPDGTATPITLDPPGVMPGAGAPTDRPLAQPRSFRIPAVPPGLIRVTDHQGRDIPGSPLDPAALAAAVPVPAAWLGPFRAPPPSGPAPLAVIIPVYRNRAVTLACISSVLAHTSIQVRVIVVDDATPEPELAAALRDLAAQGRIDLIRHDRNRGFPAAANAGMRAAQHADIVLLNADTLVPPGWLPRLHAALHAAPDIGTATPFSNDATYLSYPARSGGPMPTKTELHRLDRRAARAHGAAVIDIPTAVGFCMMIRSTCRDQTGLLDETLFAQGYGEENDFCLRARHRGWRHVAVPGLYVGHVGGVSFGTARTHLLARNLAILNRVHPGYDALIAADTSGPALAAARRGIDLAALRRRPRPAPAVALITHDLGGGVERQLRSRCDALRAQGIVPIVLRPIYALPYLQGTGSCRVEISPALPNLVYDTASELTSLRALLAGQGVRALEIHHLVGHDHALLGLAADLAIPYDVHVHDYAWFCPRITLVSGTRRYCGEPDLAGCETCIATAGSNTDEDIPVATLVARSARELQGASRIVAPARDVATRIARHFPGLVAHVMPWDQVRPPPPRRLAPPSLLHPRRVAVLGAIGIEKGFDVLLACASDAAARALPLRFTIFGHSTDDAALLATGTVFVTGPYTAEELPALVAAHSADLAFLPSIWPETWCFTLSEAWQAGLAVVAFNLGAPADRIAAHGGGRLLPLACPPERINAALLAG